jgi:hypothetical protein
LKSLDLPPLWRRLFQLTVGVGWKKKRNNIFQSWEIQKLYIELCNKRQMALLSGRDGD